MKKNKALIVLLFYTLFVVVFSIEIILSEFMDARREHLVKNSNQTNTTKLVISKNTWHKIRHKKEFILNNQYYDFVSCKVFKNQVVVNVMQDNFEHVLKKTFGNLTKKNNKNKKPVSSVTITQFFTEINSIYFHFAQNIIKETPLYKTLFSPTFHSKIFQPPRLLMAFI